MKKSGFIVFTLCFLFIIACKKEEGIIIYEPGNQTFGWAKGLKNGKEWEASGHWRSHLNDSTFWGIDFYTYSTFGEQREHVALNEIPFATGTFPVKGKITDLGDNYVGGSFGQWGDDGDVLIGFMEINDSKSSFITVSTIDTLTNTITGSYEVHFISEDKSLEFEITNGTFEVRHYQ